MTQPKHGPNFTAADLGLLAQLDQYRFKHPALPRETEGKVFLNQLLGLTGCEVSVNKLPARTSLPFYHTPPQRRGVHILKGRGRIPD